MKSIVKVLACAFIIALFCVNAATAAGTCCAAKSPASTGAGPVCDNALTPEEQAAGWQLLFDGKTLNGWGCTTPGSKGWLVENGTIFYNVQGSGYLYTEERYGNFEFKMDFMVDHGTNSGLFFRWDVLGDPVQTGIEMQLLDSAAAQNPGRHDCGAIYDILAPTENAMKPALEWNTVKLRCWKNFISVTMNGKWIVQMDLNRWKEAHKNPDGTGNKFNTAYKDMPREGHIGLQEHGGKIWFKNVKVRELN